MASKARFLSWLMLTSVGGNFVFIPMKHPSGRMYIFTDPWMLDFS